MDNCGGGRVVVLGVLLGLIGGSALLGAIIGSNYKHIMALDCEET